MMDCQYVATQRGGVALVFEGHRYNKVRDGKDGTVYWRCSRDRQCPGRAVTVHSRIKKANNKHNHSPDNGMTSAKPILNSNSLMSNPTGSNQSALAFDVAAALLRNHTANQSSPHLSNHLNNHLNHSNNHQANHSSPANSLKQNLTEATMAALLGTNLNSANSSSAAAAIASLLTQQQKHGGLFGKAGGLNSLAGLNPLHATQNNKTNADYLTNHLNEKLNSPDSHKDIQQHQQHYKDNGQFRDNLLSTGSTNYLSNASSSSASSSPLISLCGQAASFQNTSNHQRPGQFNQYNKPDYKQPEFTKHDYKQIDYNKLDLYGQFSSANHGAAMPNAPSNQSPNLSSFSFDQFKSGNQNNKNSNSSNDKSNASSKLNSSIPSALSYLNNLNSNLNSLNNNYNNLGSSLTNNRLGSPDWLGRLAGHHQLNSPLSQLPSNGQLNQLFAQFELERLAARSQDLSGSNKTAGAFPNGDEVRHKKFKPDTDSAKRDEEYRQLNGLLRKDGLEAMKKFGKTKLLNDENKKSEEPLLKNGALDDCEFDEDDENLEELDEKKELSAGFLPDGSTGALDLIKLGGLLNNPTAIFETLNQLSLTNPQMASAFALSLLGQLDQNANLQTGATPEHHPPEKTGGAPQEEAGHLPAGSRSQSDQLGYPNKRSSTDEKTENKLKAIDYSDSSDEEDQPLNMTSRSSNQLVRKLRQLMKNLNYVPEPLQAYIVPSCDAHNSEYIAKCDARREYLTGFTGSAGTAIITTDDSLLWTDGRYFAQAERQLGDGWRLMKDRVGTTPTQAEYLTKNLQSGSKVGVDARLYSHASFKKLNSALNSNGIELVPLMDNLVDLVWPDKPERPCQSIEPLDAKFCGLTWQEKIQQIRTAMQKKEASILLLSALDETAWLFNLRGSDIPFNPVFFAYTILTQDSICLFVEEEQLSSSARKQLGLDGNLNSSDPKQLIGKQQQQASQDDSMTDSPLELGSDEFRVQVRPYAAIYESLKEFLATQTGKVWISSESNYALVSLVPKTRHIDSPNPVLLMKAVKNPVEVDCMRNAHIKDAVALCEFFAWLEEEVPKGTQTEISAAKKLFELRKEQENFIQNSFETISSSGPNGAIIHYKPTESTNRSLNIEEIYLCDSGAQYLDGTTDVTRTLHFGSPSDVERQMFTRVVKGHISLASCIFPTGVKGHCLDVLARMSLWQSGLDYLHGTGHGVGCYLNVHEGPCSISSRPSPDDPGLAEGMILSNEPGYYEQDKFGIRIESLVVVTKKETQYNFNNKGYLCFDTITLVPIQTKLLDPSLLTVDEIEWLDNYHQTCREIVGNALKKQGKTAGYKWLMKETEPLG